MLPIFLQESFRPFDPSDFEYEQEEMLPIFVQELFPPMDLSDIRVQSRRKCCPFFAKNFFFVHSIFHTFACKRGGNAAHFRPRTFSAHGSVRYSSTKQEEMLSIFCQELFFRPFDLLHFCVQKRRKCCQNFYKNCFRPLSTSDF